METNRENIYEENIVDNKLRIIIIEIADDNNNNNNNNNDKLTGLWNQKVLFGI